MVAAQPFLGVGLGYRAAIEAEIREHQGAIDWLELIAEHFIHRPPEHLESAKELAAEFPLVPHGIEMSIGSDGPLDAEYVQGVAELVSAIQAPWFSDHLCFTRADGIALGQLTPLARTMDTAKAVARKASCVQSEIGRPFLLENITYYIDVGGELTEAQFLTEVLERSGCGLLLDLANVYTNSVNHGFDMFEFTSQIPLERVIQVHLAGGIRRSTVLLDSHSAAVPPEVWTLLEEVTPRMPNLRGVLVERDQDYPADFTELLADLASARDVLAQGFS